MNSAEVDSEHCIHPVIFDGICSECGAFVKPDSRYNKSQDIYVLSSTIGESKLEPFLLDRKQLALVVDLDKTLIDTIGVLNEEEAKKIIALDKEHESDYFYFRVNEMYLVRLRPYVREFLESISPYYFMQVYTLAQRPYALKVIEKIDPEGKYFNQRILTREDSPLQKKSMSDFFLSGQHMAVVIDDSRDAWSSPDGSFYGGLVQMEPFNFFSKVRQPTQTKNLQFSPKELNMDAIHDQYLVRMTEVMTEIHTRFYQDTHADVADIINRMKQSVFENSYIYFCAIWGEGCIAQKRLYISNAEEYGGHVLGEFLPYVTHIITTDPNHPDVRKAEQFSGIRILNYKWFFNSVFRFMREPEDNPIYAVEFNGKVAPLITTGQKQRTEPPEDIKTSDLDDFFEMIDQNGSNTTTRSQSNNNSGSSDDDESEYGSSCDSEDISFLYNKSEETE